MCSKMLSRLKMHSCKAAAARESLDREGVPRFVITYLCNVSIKPHTEKEESAFKH